VRTLFVGLFIIALLAGVSAKMMDNSPNHTSWLGNILNAVGFKKQDQIQKTQFDEIVHKFGDQKDDFSQGLKDQQQFLKTSQEQMSSLSQLVQDKMNNNSNIDLLRLKELMKQFQDRSALLIEKGKELENFNDQRLKINQKIAFDSYESSLQSNIDRSKFIQSMKDNLRRQQEMINEQSQENKGLEEKIGQIRDQIQKVHDSVAFKENPQFTEQLKSLSDKTQAVLDNVHQKQEQIKATNQSNLANLESTRQRMDDLKQRSKNSIDQNRSHIQDQQQALNDRVQDQLERIRERNK
jgi:hypothetical protein